jgi:hypothetical protein
VPNSRLLPTQLAPNATHSPVRIEPVEAAAAAATTRDLSVLAARIYDAGTEEHREKCGFDPSRIKWALRDAAARGDDPFVVTEAMVAFVTSGDQRKPGRASHPHSTIDNDRWRKWIGKAPGHAPSRDLNVEPKPLTEITHDGVTYAIPKGGCQATVGTWESPGIKRQLMIMDRWKTMRLVDWDPVTWGPEPGKPGCRIWPSVLERVRCEIWSPPAGAPARERPAPHGLRLVAGGPTDTQTAA